MIAILRRVSFASKRVAAILWHRSGLWLAWKRLVLGRRPVVLTYHRVLPSHSADRSWSHPAIVVTRETFETQMQLLRRWFRVLSLQEFVDRLQSGRGFEPGSCLVTFDDGWHDTYAEAWPVLKANGIPAVVFLPVQYIGSGEMFWQEEVGALLFALWNRAQDDRDWTGEARATLSAIKMESILDAVDAAAARTAALDLVRICKRDRVDVVVVRNTLRALTSRVAHEVDAFMDWDQVREMAASGIAFGAHGVTHRLLPTLPANEAQLEVVQSRQEIERHLALPVTAFSYPNGEWSPPVADAVRRDGFAVAFSTDAGRVDESERFAIRRINIHEAMTGHPSMFLARVLGVL